MTAALRTFEDPSAMQAFHAPFENWPTSQNPLDWSFEGTIEAIYRACIRPGDAVLDGGACEGRHTLPMSDCVGTGGRVFAVEPNPRARAVLQTNIAERQNVEVVPAALAEAAGEAEFSIVIGAMGRSSLRTPAALTALESVTVPLAKVDDLDLGGRRMSFMKLDLEGGEFGALRGATRRLTSDAPVICFEHNKSTMPLFDLSYPDFFQLFHDLEYDLIDILGTAFNAAVASWDLWKPNYLVALPRRDADAAQRAAAALEAYTNGIYRNIDTWTALH